jgi:hypothetical protein
VVYIVYTRIYVIYCNEFITALTALYTLCLVCFLGDDTSIYKLENKKLIMCLQLGIIGSK